MGFFSKTPKTNPKITFEGIEFTFHCDCEQWEFTYCGTRFSSFEPVLTLPSKAQLDSIVSTLKSLMPEMRARLKKGLSEWGNSKIDDGESYSLDVNAFVNDSTFTVTWSDGKSWGDLIAEFTIQDNAIIDESWGD
jgi:hypothetical protein